MNPVKFPFHSRVLNPLLFQKERDNDKAASNLPEIFRATTTGRYSQKITIILVWYQSRALMRLHSERPFPPSSISLAAVPNSATSSLFQELSFEELLEGPPTSSLPRPSECSIRWQVKKKKFATDLRWGHLRKTKEYLL